MSRGLSEQQRKILATLAPDHLYTITELGAWIYGPTITRTEYESLRRAVHSLEKRELIADNWWRMHFAEHQSAKYGLPHVVDRVADKFCDSMDRMQQKRLHGDAIQHIDAAASVAPAPHPTHSRMAEVPQ